MDEAPLRLTGLAGTFLGDLDDASLRRVLDSATLREFRRGQQICADGVQPRLGVVIEGVARSYIVGADGRQLTLRYIRPPAVVTTASTAIVMSPVPLANQAVTDVTLLELNVPLLVDLYQPDSSVAFAFANELSRRFTDVYRSFGATFFGSLRERLAAHLLQAAEPASGRRLFAQINQVELAEALGSAREVVGRTLRSMQSEGKVVISRGGVEIVDVPGLLATAGPWGSPPRLFSLDVAGHADESFDSLAQPVVGFDTSLRVVYGNRAVYPTFGIERAALIGRDVGELLGRPALTTVRDAVASFESDPTPRTLALPRDLTGRRADGTEFPLEIVALPVRRRDVLFVFTTLVDVSYRRVLRDLVASGT